MQIRDLIPWSRESGELSRHRDGDHPLQGLQRDINRVFDDFWSRFDRGAGGTHGLPSAAPRTDVSETDDGVEVCVELPGMDEKDIDVSLGDGVLTIRGERKAEKEEEKKGYFLSERSYGSFYRSIPLPPGADTDKAEAKFKNGVLTITLPKTPEAREKVRKIAVKAA